MEVAKIFLENFSSPPILFFVLGIIAGFIKSDLNVPEQISRYFAIYLMIAIGFKGGVTIAETPEINNKIIYTIIAGIITGFTQPFLGYKLLRMTTKLDFATAAALASHYGSVSMVTFVTALGFLSSIGISYEGYIVAVLALMEAPAILTGLYIAHRADPRTIASTTKATPKLTREIFTNGAILLLAGSFLIGCISGTKGMEKMQGFLVDPFHGILAFFLLDMGIVVSKQFSNIKEFNFKLLLFGIYMPLLGAFIGLLISKYIGLDVGTATLFIILISSSSYIAVTAAMRLALPEAKAAIYLPISLGVTFPFNIGIGIPLYYKLAEKFLI